MSNGVVKAEECGALAGASTGTLGAVYLGTQGWPATVRIPINLRVQYPRPSSFGFEVL